MPPLKIYYALHKNFVRLCHCKSRESLKLTIGNKIFHQLDDDDDEDDDNNNNNNKVRAINFSAPKNLIVKTTKLYIIIFISAFEFLP